MRGGGSELTAVISHSEGIELYPTLDISQNFSRHSEVTKSLPRLDIVRDFLRHSEQSEESISKSILNLKDSSVTSFPQNDDFGLGLGNNCSSPLPMGEGALVAGEGLSCHSEVTKSLPRLDIVRDFLRHSEQSEESISKSISNLKDSSVTSFPQNDDYGLGMANDSSSSLPLTEGVLRAGNGLSRHSEGECPTESSLSLTSKVGLLRAISDYSGCRRSNVRLQLASFGFPPHSTENLPRNDEKKAAFTLTEVLSPLTQISFFCRAKAEISPSPARGEGKKNFSPHPTCARKTAFTLAEVLITLGIIGVVAAMTLPTLIMSYKKQETVAKIKKTYSVLNQAYKHAQLDNGEPINWDDPYTIGIEKYFQTYWYPYLQINKICKTYKDCGYKDSFPWILQNGSKFNIGLIGESTRRVIILPDGVLLQIIIATGEATQANYYLNVDLNGAGKPNKLGKDVFLFNWDGVSGIVAKGSDKSETEIDNDCISSGQYCAAKIIKDGWEIKRDYPWK